VGGSKARRITRSKPPSNQPPKPQHQPGLRQAGHHRYRPRAAPRKRPRDPAIARHQPAKV